MLRRKKAWPEHESRGFTTWVADVCGNLSEVSDAEWPIDYRAHPLLRNVLNAERSASNRTRDGPGRISVTTAIQRSHQRLLEARPMAQPGKKGYGHRVQGIPGHASAQAERLREFRDALFGLELLEQLADQLAPLGFRGDLLEPYTTLRGRESRRRFQSGALRDRERGPIRPGINVRQPSADRNEGSTAIALIRKCRTDDRGPHGWPVTSRRDAASGSEATPHLETGSRSCRTDPGRKAREPHPQFPRQGATERSCIAAVGGEAQRNQCRVFGVIADHALAQEEAVLPVASPQSSNALWREVLRGQAQRVSNCGADQDASTCPSNAAVHVSASSCAFFPLCKFDGRHLVRLVSFHRGRSSQLKLKTFALQVFVSLGVESIQLGRPLADRAGIPSSTQ